MSIKKRLADMRLNKKFKKIRDTHGIQKEQVLFSSFSGKSYSDNPRAVSEKLHEIRPQAKIAWVFLENADLSDVPGYVQIVKKEDKDAYFQAIATSKVWVNNMTFPAFPKAKGQRFVQVWHGDRAFKKILYDSAFAGKEYEESKEGFCDLAVAGSDYGVHQFRSGMRYNGEILQCGTPRDDVLIHPDEARIAAAKEKLNLNPDIKILLYAPTLRRESLHGKGEQRIQDLDLNQTLAALQNRYPSKWVCLLRAHPGVGGLTGFEESENVKEVSAYPDMTDLLLIADVLITDYSSCAGDFALRNLPVLLYQSDRADYQEKDREFYFDMQDCPYYIAENQEQLNRIIKDLNTEAVKENCDRILKFYNTFETGEAAFRVAERISEWCQEG